MNDDQTDAVLDDPVGESLRGRHAHLARQHGNSVAYRADIATFSAVPLTPSERDWSDLATLLGPDAFADLFSLAVTAPSGWAPVFTLDGLQLIAEKLPPIEPSNELVELGPADVPDMLELVDRARPGPFWQGTATMGRYVGIRVDWRLLAMAGERLRPPGWTEISAVCTDPAARGRGYASRLVTELAATIAGRDERPFLHVVADNLGARALYERLGFRVRRQVTFHGYRTPSN